jgi:hypothetical protein
MTCEVLLHALNDLVDGIVDPGLCKDLERHLAGCKPCHVVIDTIRKTITLYKDDQVYELPPLLRDAIESKLRARWGELHPGRNEP